MIKSTQRPFIILPCEVDGQSTVTNVTTYRWTLLF